MYTVFLSKSYKESNLNIKIYPSLIKSTVSLTIDNIYGHAAHCARKIVSTKMIIISGPRIPYIKSTAEFIENHLSSSGGESAVLKKRQFDLKAAVI